MIGGRALRIGGAAVRLALVGASERLRGVPSERSRLPRELRLTFDRLGPAFVKAGQALSLREDILPLAYVRELANLNDKVAPFDAAVGRREIASALDAPIESVFRTFEDEPLAAASIAQVHAATLLDGSSVVVKVRRPGIRRVIDRDMRALARVLRLAARLSPTLASQQPVRIVEEIWRNLVRETDFRLEARAMRRFAQGLSALDKVEAPAVFDELVRESVLVQERKSGLMIGDAAVAARGPELAGRIAETYLVQFFVLGFFHGDPHPGNLFFEEDGRICFHDFGIFGELDLATRRNLAMFLQAFVNGDADWMLDYAVALGLVVEPGDQRPPFVAGMQEILSDYASTPLKEWSIGDLFRRVSSLGPPGSVRLPWNMLVLMRTVFILESILRRLDPQMNVVEMLSKKAAPMISQLTTGGQKTALRRLRYEAALAAEEAPRALGSALRRLRVGGFRLELPIRVAGLEDSTMRLERMGNRLAMAIVTLGLFIGSSLLMQHSIGPRLFGVPALALAGFLLAIWYSLRLARAVARSGHL